MCSGKRIPDTFVDEYIRVQEVFDEQTTAYLLAEFKREAASLLLDQSLS